MFSSSPSVNDFGAVGDGAADDTAVFQSCIDSASASGGCVVNVPNGRYVVSQLVMKPNVYLRGESFHAFGGQAERASTLIQKPGTGLDLIRFTESSTPGWAAPFGLSDLVLVGDTSAATGRGIALVSPAGADLRIQDVSTLERIMVRRFAGDGIYIPGGGPIVLSNIATMFNGGYGLRIAAPALNSNVLQSVSIINFSGDGNSGGAAIRFENIGADYSHSLFGIKSEQRANTDRGGAMAQPHVLEFHNCAHDVAIHGMQHISSGLNTTKPGDAISITGVVRPRIAWVAAKVRVLDTQIVGADPVLIRDAVSNSNGGRTVALGGPITGTYC